MIAGPTGYVAVVEWWQRRSTASQKRLQLRAGAVALGVVVGSIVVAKFTWGSSGPGIVTPFAFFGLFVAAVILFVVAIVSSEELVDELEASHPPRVRKRGVVPRALRRGIAALARAVLAWLLSIGLALRREMTPEEIAQRWRALADALSGVPPLGVSATHAGPLARPAPRLSRTALDTRHRAPRRSLPTGRDALNRLEQLYRRHLSNQRPRAERLRHSERHPSRSRSRTT